MGATCLPHPQPFVTPTDTAKVDPVPVSLRRVQDINPPDKSYSSENSNNVTQPQVAKGPRLIQETEKQMSVYTAEPRFGKETEQGLLLLRQPLVPRPLTPSKWCTRKAGSQGFMSILIGL